MPGQQGVWRNNSRDLSKHLAAQYLCFYRQATTLIIGESYSSSAEVFSEEAVFFEKIIDGALLVLIHPSCNREQQELKLIQARSHLRSLPSARNLSAL